ncbi:malate dehydrogenase [Candidatus Woesearchaeota archaeon]|nr:malate dehydrogenase [Candidatus Woesearchaeota archaeon]
MSKISIIGAGFVGATAAYVLAMKDLVDEVALVDILAKPTEGKALDIYEATGVFGLDVKVKGGDDYALIDGSDVVVITAGVPRKAGQSRDDVLAINAKIMKDVVAKVKKHTPDAVLLIVSNPLDAMTYLAAKESGYDKKKVIGMAGTLDTTRYKTFISEKASVSPRKIDAMVLGGHGDLMVPLSRHAFVEGKPLSKVLDAETITAIEERTKHGGAEIVKLLGNGSAYFAVGGAIYEVLHALLTDSDKPVPVSAWLTGQYGLQDIFLGVPCLLGKDGVEKVVELELADDELAALQHSGKSVKELTQELEKL